MILHSKISEKRNVKSCVKKVQLLGNLELKYSWKRNFESHTKHLLCVLYEYDNENGLPMDQTRSEVAFGRENETVYLGVILDAKFSFIWIWGQSKSDKYGIGIT